MEAQNITANQENSKLLTFNFIFLRSHYCRSIPSVCSKRIYQQHQHICNIPCRVHCMYDNWQIYATYRRQITFSSSNSCILNVPWLSLNLKKNELIVNIHGKTDWETGKYRCRGNINVILMTDSSLRDNSSKQFVNFYRYSRFQ